MVMTKLTKETLDEIVKRIDENVAEVKVQTTKTNGRVSELEKDMTDQKGWRREVKGALLILSIIITGIIIPLVFKYLSINLFK